MSKSKKPESKLVNKLSKRLTPETDQQPMIRATSWQVYWQYDLASDDTECVGVVMKIADKLYWNLPSPDMLLAWPVAERQMLTSQLDALAYRLTTGALSAPMGMSLRNERESAGNNISEILAYLWRHGPALTLRKKKKKPTYRMTAKWAFFQNTMKSCTPNAGRR